jgi:succinyl-diaminopimelate desuccinylase
LNSVCNEVLGASYEPYTMGGGTYARRLPLAAAFGHLRREKIRPGGGGHQADECVSIAGLEDMMRVYLSALLRLDNLELT